MTRKLSTPGLAWLLFCACLWASAAAAAARPNFSGTWVLDHTRSYGVPRDTQQTMTVVHDGDGLSVETRIVTPQGERVVRDTYRLDGTEAEFTPQQQGPAEIVGKGRRTSKWLPGDRGLVVQEDFQTKGPAGQPVDNQLTRKWILWPDGTLSVDLYHDGPRGSFETKRVFAKKQ